MSSSYVNGKFRLDDGRVMVPAFWTRFVLTKEVDLVGSGVNRLQVLGHNGPEFRELGRVLASLHILTITSTQLLLLSAHCDT